MSEPENDCFSYERLRVWQKAVDLAGEVYSITKGFGRDEVFGLTSQLRRASVSVAANIAEGSSRAPGKDKARFIEIAYGSLCEIATLFHIAAGQDMVTKEQLDAARADIFEMSRMLSGLKRAALESGDPPSSKR